MKLISYAVLNWAATAIVAAIFERETLGQRWSNPIFYSNLLNQGVFLSEGRLERGRNDE